MIKTQTLPNGQQAGRNALDVEYLEAIWDGPFARRMGCEIYNDAPGSQYGYKNHGPLTKLDIA